MSSERLESVDDELGDWIDPLLGTGFTLFAIERLVELYGVSLELLVGAILVSVLWTQILYLQPFLHGTDLLTDRIADRLDDQEGTA